MDVLKELSNHESEITIRHLFYRLVTGKVIEKTEKDYARLCSCLAKWRRSGLVPWGAFADSTRFRIGANLFDGPESALRNTVECYRKNLWLAQDDYVEIWTEKDAIASILTDVCAPFGVNVFVLRGFSSLTSLYEGANLFRRLQQRGKAVHVAYFGDHDPSGRHIDRAAANALEHDFGVHVDLQRVAVTAEQIVHFNLPTRPPKKGDTRAKGWEGECVEVDAMPITVFRSIAERSITAHIEPHAWAQLQQIEAAEKESLREVMNAWKGGQN